MDRAGCSRRCLVWLMSAALICAGCSKPSGPRRVNASGTVRLAGHPLPPGSISFQPEQGHSGPVANGEIVDGRYRLTTDDGPTPGPHRVVITLAPPKAVPSPNDPPRPKITRWEFTMTVPDEGFTKDFDVEDK